ncbi:hypothetical protein [Bartonella tamiae]|uniref:Lipoprotein n=1 Tax=Bartonella tamiae Th239 TaxID=1094558 RepID=J0ZQ85_9HYPH|nr:hypothetical protein [Bartonella tamiae]EJF90788.1 hypothetical protein ME5_00624 [Bartonella tamiae Th239]EJF93427.1 hypothetical protein MEG_01258 [Bartonella tamiae Th307]
MKHKAGLMATGLIVTSFVLTGCGVSGPTYGTDKTAAQQLLDDVSNLASIRRSSNNNQIDTKPRPDLVRPAPGAKGVLPQPQVNVAQSGSPDWPESPEQRRQRLRAEATANQDNPNYVSPIIQNGRQSTQTNAVASSLNGIHRNELSPTIRKQQSAEYQRLKQQNAGGTATTRKYLSEPPLAYRQPAATAPIGEQGTDEEKKERERKRAAREASGKKSWWPF